jgi:predicted RNA binding protein YcfA (HicA-like mRNA interferase family)
MPEYPRLTAKEAEKLLLHNGFALDRQKGSHRIYTKKSHRMVLPTHAGEILHPKIIKQLFEVIHESEDKA